MTESIPTAKPVTRFGRDMPVPKVPTNSGKGLRISFIVVVYAMPEQASRTLHSLSADYQIGVDGSEYEVLVVENRSDQNLSQDKATQYGDNFRYFLRDETAPTPIHAINFGAGQARGEYVAIMIDGARMLSPGVVANMLSAVNLADEPVICVPGYHLGDELQQFAVQKGYNEKAEAQLMSNIGWPEQGYRLFEICCPSGTSAGGFFKPIGESNCLGLRKSLFDQLGGYDTAFTGRGGGMVNLDFYRRAIEFAGSQLILLLGEGSFHQFHGGETTGKEGINREQLIQDITFEYFQLRGKPYTPPEQRAIFLGAVPDSALRLVSHNADAVVQLNNL